MDTVMSLQSQMHLDNGRRCRQQYRLLKEGKPSFLTGERLQKLESIGFEWPAMISASETRNY